MKAFDLERAKAGEPVVCRGGMPARIICFDRNRPLYKIVALVTVYYGEEGKFGESVEVFCEDGRYMSRKETKFDLMML